MTGAATRSTFAASAFTRALWPISHAATSRAFSRSPAQHRCFRRAHSASRRSRRGARVLHLTAAAHAGRARRKFWREVRARFLVPRDLAFLNAANLCPMSLPVIEAIEKNMRGYEVNPSPEPRSVLLHAREDARTLLAEALRVTPEEFVLTRNTTEGNNFVSSGLTLGAGRRGHRLVGQPSEQPQRVAAEGDAIRVHGRRRCRRRPRTPAPTDTSSSSRRRSRRERRCSAITYVSSNSGDMLPVAELVPSRARRECSRWSTARRRSACSTST